MFKNLLSLLLFTFVGFTLYAQETVQYKADAKVPMDEKVRYGVLDNGLTYYILKNKTPENRAEFFLINNVGAMQETPGQNGFAHLNEHMCFNGTKNFEKKEIIYYLESIGMKFGPEINAYTVYDQTVYTLNKVPVDTKENIDTSLMVLFDWATNVSMETDEINAERGVVREELRTRRSAMSRMRDEANKILFAGSKYAVHNIIGTVDVIDNSPCDTLRAFYNTWYRPDLQAIIIVGDINVDEMEVKVKNMFAKLPVHKNAPERKYFQIPDHDSIKVAIEQDKESPYTIIQAVYKKPVPKVKDQAYYRQQYLNNLASGMINARLAEKSQAVDPPFMQAFSYYGNLIRTKDAYMSFAVASNDKIKIALDEILSENERVKNFGFLDSELDRAKKELLAGIEKGYNERNKKKSGDLANTIKSNYLEAEPIPSDDWDYAFAKQVVNAATLEEINAFVKNWITDKNLVIMIMATEKEGFTLPTEAEILAIATGVHTKTIEKYVDAASNKPLISTKITPGTIVKESTDKQGITRWTLSNGVNVVFKPTTFKDDEILMSANSLGGWSKLKQKDDISSKIAADVVDQSGLGEFDNIALQKKLAGKNVSIYPFIGELTEGFKGRSNIADFNTMLKLNYLYFTAPRADKDAFTSYMQKEKASLVNKNANPQAVFIDTIRNVMSQYSPRKRNMTPEMLDEAKLSRIKFIFSERFGDPSGFTYYFVGNIDPKLQRDTILKYLGGLPTVNRTETWTDLGIRNPSTRVEKHFTREMETDKATVYVSFSSTAKKYTIEDRLMLEMVKEYLTHRYFETLREDQGGTYGASLWTGYKQYPTVNYNIGIFFDANPEKLDTMMKIVYNEVELLKNKLPEEKAINNTIENKIKEHKEKIKENKWWLNTIKSDDFNNEDFKNFDYIKFWSSITPKKVQKAANKFLSKDVSVEIIQTKKK